MSEQTNRLIHEKSPYLLQHARNPVDWRPWGEEAFQAAREQDKPLLVSIGYATCHWCHVMERESFEDHAIATLLNEAFINVKVDREERPDIDTVYMTACQIMSGRGGWPLNVLLTPEGKPFFTFTYLPRESGMGRLGMLELPPRVMQLWRERRDELLQSAEEVTRSLRQACQEGFRDQDEAGPGKDIGPEIQLKALKEFQARFDAEHGGFGQAPKFPMPHVLLFLLRLAKAHPQEAQGAVDMVQATLRGMRLGGIFDHVGFGFHRYATDAQWLLPHFEKMLYDQAMLAMAYLDGFEATGREEHLRTVEEVFTYVLRDLLSPEGAFFCAEDADSEGEEGKFYVFSLQEARDVLDRNADLAVDVLNFEEQGNFQDEATAERTGANIPHLKAPLEELARRLGQAPKDLAARFDMAREALFAARDRRPRPLLDDKILTDWNGLMIAALARGAQVMPDSRYLRDATRAADFILEHLRGEALDGGKSNTSILLHRYRDGQAAIPGMQQDYAFFCWGLVELHKAGGGERYLRAAVELCDLMLELFWDAENQGLFMTSPRTGEELICRPKEIFDGALPSGNAVAALVLERLGRQASRDDLRQRAAEIRRAAARTAASHPGAHAFLLHAALESAQ